MRFLRANNSDCQTRMLNVFVQTAIFLEIKKRQSQQTAIQIVGLLLNAKVADRQS